MDFGVGFFPPNKTGTNVFYTALPTYTNNTNLCDSQAKVWKDLNFLQTDIR